MKILFLSAYFPPEIGSGPKYAFEMAQSMARYGHDVTVVTGFPTYNLPAMPPQYKGKLWQKEEMGGVNVLRVWWLPTPQRIPAFRGISHFAIAFSLWLAGLITGRPDIIYTSSPPLTLGMAVYLLSVLWKVPYVFKVEDIFPQYAIDLGVLKNPLVIRFFRWMERFVYKNSSCVMVHSEGNRRHIVEQTGTEDSKVMSIPNWVDTTFLTGGPTQNPFRQKLGLDDKFVILFAGTMGWSQNLTSVIKAADLLRDRPEISFVLVGDGVDKVNLQNSIETLKLTNVTLLPMQSPEIYPEVVRSADVNLVTLGPSVATPVVPGKLSSIMACERPVIAAVPLEGDAAEFVRQAKCGICVPPDDIRGLADAILELQSNPEKATTMARNGRLFAEQQLGREACTRQYEALFMKLVSDNRVYV